MSPKQQRKFHGTRRPTRRSRAGKSWVRDEYRELEAGKPQRLRLSLGGTPLT